MNSKYLTESARITDAYSMIYASKTSINESKDAAKTAKPVNESSECGSLSCALKSGDLPTEGKGSAKTGSKLGRRPMMPFEKRDAKSDAGHRIPMKKTFGNGKVTNNFKTKATEKSTEIGSAQTGSKLGAGKMVEFDKRDAKPTAIGKVGGVKNVGCVKGIKESEDDFEMEVIDTNVDDGVTDVEDVEKEEGCCEKCKELLELVKDTFEQIYDNLSDDDKSLVDEVKSEIEEKLSDGEDEEEEVEDADGEDEEKEEETDESVVTEAAAATGVKTGSKVLGAIAKGTGKTVEAVLKALNGTQKVALKNLIKAAEKGATKAEMDAAIQAAKKANVPAKLIGIVAKNGKVPSGAAAKAVAGTLKDAAKDAIETGAVKAGGVSGAISKYPLVSATAAGVTGAATDRYLLGGSKENANAVSSTIQSDEDFEKELKQKKANGATDEEIAAMRAERIAKAKQLLQNSKGDVSAYGKDDATKGDAKKDDDDDEKAYERFRNHMDRYNADRKNSRGGNSQGNGGSYGLMDGLGDLGAGIGTALGTPLGAVGGIVGKVGGGLGNAIGKLGGGILGGGTYS